MFEALMKKGGYRVDYLNQKAAGSPDALGFYVRGQLPDQQPYSRDAKHHLYAGMLVIQNQLGSQNLVSVYLDVNEPDNLNRPGYVRLKEDMRSGMFRRLFTFDLNDLVGSQNAVEDLCQFYSELGGFDLMSYDSGMAQPAFVDPQGITTQPCFCLAV